VLKIALPDEASYEKSYKTYLFKIAENLKIDTFTLQNNTIKVERKFDLTFPSKTVQLELVRQVILGFICNVDFSAQAIEDIGLAVDEACTNIVKHSYSETQEGNLDVSIAIARDQVTISIIDTGEMGQQFDPTRLEPFEKQKYLERLERGGLGVYIIKTIMDEVEYNIQPGTYNRLKMVKYTKQKSLY